MWIEIIFPDDEGTDKPSDHLLVQITLPLIGISDDLMDLHLLQMDVAAQGGKNRVENRDFAAYLECLDVTDLLDETVVLLNVPVLVMTFLEFGLGEGFIGIGLRQKYDVMAQLVF